MWGVFDAAMTDSLSDDGHNVMQSAREKFLG